jgi:hypothetical protein
MDLQKLIKHHKSEAEHWRRLGAGPATELHRAAVAFLEDFEMSFDDDAIKWGDQCRNCRSA